MDANDIAIYCDSLRNELQTVENKMKGIEQNPPTMDYFVEFMQINRDYEALKARKLVLEKALQQWE